MTHASCAAVPRALALVAALLWVACEQEKPPAPPPGPSRSDLGLDAAVDGGATDADVPGVDADLVDGGEPPDGEASSDADVLGDAGVVADGDVAADADVLDGGGERDADVPFDAEVLTDFGPLPPLPEGGPPPGCRDDAGVFDSCLCELLGPRCGGELDRPCAAGAACVDTGCGYARCVATGSACVADTDCASGATCVVDGGGIGRCQRATSECVDSRDCPLGYACDISSAGRVCVNRRIGCSPFQPCPHGYECRAAEDMRLICVPVHRRCTQPEACPAMRCVDIDLDGQSECAFSGSCVNNLVCGAGSVCSFDPERVTMACGQFGLCQRESDCAAGFTCIDVWGDGLRQCEPLGGTCTAGTCPSRTLCGSLLAGGPPQCLPYL